MTRKPRHSLERYGVAILACAAALALRLLVPVDYLRHAPLLLFLLATFVAAWAGGWGPGLLGYAAEMAKVEDQRASQDGASTRRH